MIKFYSFLLISIFYAAVHLITPSVSYHSSSLKLLSKIKMNDLNYNYRSYKYVNYISMTSTSSRHSFIPTTKPVVIKPTAHDIYTRRDPYRVKIFDTTLRDGEQAPGCTMNSEEKMAVAKQLARLGVDVIEAGFPVASQGDFDAVSKIAQVIGNLENPPIICGLARAIKNDIKTCYEAVKFAKFPRIHTFLATSDIHMEHKLKKTREEVKQIVGEMVRYAKSLCDDVEFSGEDALRSDPDFLCEVYSIAIEAGATTINVPDTVGYTTPAEFFSLIKKLRENVRGIDDVTISVHGHNDLGLAVANFLAAVEGGARQLECTINGIGERAGNAALEELVMALHVRKQYYNKYFNRPEDSDVPLTNIKTQEIFKSSRLVSSLTGGIHQDGVLKNRRTYEIMDAESIGLSENFIVLGKHSGRHAFRKRLEELGFTSLSENDINRAFVKFKDLADKKKEISNADLESIMNEEIHTEAADRYKLVHVQVFCGNTQIPTATVTLRDEKLNCENCISSIGTGPVDATYQAVRKLTSDSTPSSLLEYSVSSVTAGIDALGEVTVRLQDKETARIVVGRSSNTDVIVASAQAYVNAMNRLEALKGTKLPTHPQFNSIS